MYMQKLGTLPEFANIINQIVLLLVISRVCAAFDKFKAWESDRNICFPDLSGKLPHLEVYEQAPMDKSKQQPGLR